jgi:hypothetical protein
LLAWTGAALITLSWPANVAGAISLPPKLAVLFAATFGSLAGTSRSLRTAAAVAIIALYFGSGPVLRHLPRTPLRPLEPATRVADRHYDPMLASTQAAVEARQAPADYGATIYDIAVRVPVWTGLALILAAGFSVRKTSGLSSGS